MKVQPFHLFLFFMLFSTSIYCQKVGPDYSILHHSRYQFVITNHSTFQSCRFIIGGEEYEILPESSQSFDYLPLKNSTIQYKYGEKEHKQLLKYLKIENAYHEQLTGKINSMIKTYYDSMFMQGSPGTYESFTGESHWDGTEVHQQDFFGHMTSQVIEGVAVGMVGGFLNYYEAKRKKEAANALIKSSALMLSSEGTNIYSKLFQPQPVRKAVKYDYPRHYFVSPFFTISGAIGLREIPAYQFSGQFSVGLGLPFEFYHKPRRYSRFYAIIGRLNHNDYNDLVDSILVKPSIIKTEGEAGNPRGYNNEHISVHQSSYFVGLEYRYLFYPSFFASVSLSAPFHTSYYIELHNLEENSLDEQQIDQKIIIETAKGFDISRLIYNLKLGWNMLKNPKINRSDYERASAIQLFLDFTYQNSAYSINEESYPFQQLHTDNSISSMSYDYNSPFFYFGIGLGIAF